MSSDAADPEQEEPPLQQTALAPWMLLLLLLLFVCSILKTLIYRNTFTIRQR